MASSFLFSMEFPNGQEFVDVSVFVSFDFLGLFFLLFVVLSYSGVRFFSVLLYLTIFYFVLLLSFRCLFSDKRQKRGRYGWEGRWEGTGSSRGQRHYYQKISYKKNLLRKTCTRQCIDMDM